MSEEVKTFWDEHGVSICLGVFTVVLGLSKVFLGLNITWLWVFAPIWLPLLTALGILGFMACTILSILVAVFMIGSVAIIAEERAEQEDTQDADE